MNNKSAFMPSNNITLLKQVTFKMHLEDLTFFEISKEFLKK